MSKITLAPNASGTGTLTVAAPNTNSDYTLTLPAETGTVLTSGGAIDVNASAPADSLAISSAGNVGIGTSSPGQKLHVAGNTGSTIISVGDSTLTEPYVYLAADASGNVGSLYTRSNHPMVFGTNNDERMRIDSSGNVGIGTNSPNTASARTVLTVASAGAGGGEIDLTVGGTTALRVLTDGSYNTEFRNPQNAPLIFGTNNTERMRIASDGKVLLNTTTSYGSESKIAVWTANSGCYEANGNTDYYPFAVFRGGTLRGSIYQSGTSTAYNTSSDYRLKENIAPMTGALATVAKLKPCTYTWKEDGSAGQGFIAHELQEVVPDCVTGAKDAVDADGKIIPQGVDTSFLVATLTAAIQELKAQLDSSNLILTGVKTELDAAKERIAALEAGNVPT